MTRAQEAVETYEFASSEWARYAGRWVNEALDGVDLSGVDVEFCEEFTDPPAHLTDGASTVGWHMVIKDGAIDVGPGVIDARSKIVADYATILPLARMVFDPADTETAARAAAIIAKATEEKKFVPPADATPSANLPQLAGLHNALALRTA